MTVETRSLKGLRRGNKAAVLFLLMREGELSRARIAEKTGLTGAAVTQLVRELIAEELIKESGEAEKNAAGRRETLLRFSGDRIAAVGVNMESDFTHVSLCTWDEVIAEEIHPTARLFQNGVQALNQRIAALISASGGRKIVGVGIAASGIIDEKNGVSVTSYGILPDGFPLAEEVAKGTGREVSIINNVRAQARALITEREDDFMLVKHGPGIGCAVITGCSAIAGATGRAGEIGHTVVKERGEPCRCGKRGCLEAYVSEKRIVALYESKTGTELPINAIYDTFGTDSAADAILSDCLRLIAVSVSNAAMLLNPAKVLVTGGIFSRKPLFDAFCEAVSKAGFGGAFAISMVGDDKNTKAFSGARHIILERVFGV